MKIAVYAIALNEEANVAKWLASAADADFVLLADTGSTDNTVELAKELAKDAGINLTVINVNINPWRFEDARNAALAAIPLWIDICVSLDLDERLNPDWSYIITENWSIKVTDRLRYNYIWSWTEDQQPALTYYGDKIHARKGFRWANPVHEVLEKDKRLGNEIQAWTDITLITHHPDMSKSRSNYLPLLALAVQENPWNDRNAHYYARDLLFSGYYNEALAEFNRHLSLPTAVWKPERAASYRYLGDCYFALKNWDMALHSFNMAVEEAPELREPWVARAQFHRFQKNWKYVLADMSKCLAITERPNSYINWADAWSDWPERMYKEAVEKYNEQSSST